MFVFCLSLALPVHLENCKQTSQSNVRPFARAIENFAQQSNGNYCLSLNEKTTAHRNQYQIVRRSDVRHGRCRRHSPVALKWKFFGFHNFNHHYHYYANAIHYYHTHCYFVEHIFIFRSCRSSFAYDSVECARRRSSFITRLFHVLLSSLTKFEVDTNICYWYWIVKIPVLLLVYTHSSRFAAIHELAHTIARCVMNVEGKRNARKIKLNRSHESQCRLWP